VSLDDRQVPVRFAHFYPLCRRTISNQTTKERCAISALFRTRYLADGIPVYKFSTSFPGVFSLQTKDEEDPFYTGCHTTKNCFGAPAGCIKTKDCVAAVAVIVQGDEYHFEMQAREDAKYVAVGLSDDKNMVIARRCARKYLVQLLLKLSCNLNGKLHNLQKYTILSV